MIRIAAQAPVWGTSLAMLVMMALAALAGASP
jgi:hypothetical protein